MGSTASSRNYLLSEFPNGAVNVPVLEAEIVVAALSVPLANTPQLTGSSCLMTFAGLLTATDITALDTVVAAHQGLPFGDTLQQAQSLTDSTESSTTWQSKVSLAAEPLPAGTYIFGYVAEFQMQAAVANAGAQVRATYMGNEVYQSVNDLIAPITFNVSVPADMVAGAKPVFGIEFRRLGGSSGVAVCRRARLTLLKAT